MLFELYFLHATHTKELRSILPENTQTWTQLSIHFFFKYNLFPAFLKINKLSVHLLQPTTLLVMQKKAFLRVSQV